MVELNKRTQKGNPKVTLVLLYGSVEFEFACLRIYANVPSVTNDHLSSQLGYLMLLSDQDVNTHELDLCNEKASRTVQQDMAADFFKLVELFDCALSVSKDLEANHNNIVPISLLRDATQVFDTAKKVLKTA